MAARKQNDMEKAAGSFLRLLKNNEEDRLTSRKRQEQETQVFWEAENLQLNRQKKMGIRETFELENLEPTKEDQKNKVKYPNGHVIPRKKGSIQMGESQRLVRVKRSIWKDDKIVKKFHSYCDCSVNLLQSDVDKEEKVACPNCGAYGTIESYIDGCDFCGSQFEVSDFKPKVSGFSVIENLQQMSSRMEAGITRAYVIFFLVVWCTGFFGGILGSIITHAVGFTGGRIQLSGSGLWAFYVILDKVIGSVFKAFFIMIASSFFFGFFEKKQVSICNEEIAREGIPFFSTIKFQQEIDHRLRTMVMGETKEQSMAYSDIDLTEFMAAHSDVFDMSVAKIEFLSVRKDAEKQENLIEANVTVKLYRMKGQGRKKKIREEYEMLHVIFSEAESGTKEKLTAIREYKCPGCGNGINIFEGTTCPYCKQTLDKHSLGLVLEECSWTKKTNLYRLIPTIVLVAAAVILIL